MHIYTLIKKGKQDLWLPYAVSRHFGVKLPTSALSDIKQLSYLNLLPTFWRDIPLICGFIEFHKGKDLPESAVVIFFPMKKARHLAFYTYMENRLCFSEP